jgi:hypothetical protein
MPSEVRRCVVRWQAPKFRSKRLRRQSRTLAHHGETPFCYSETKISAIWLYAIFNFCVYIFFPRVYLPSELKMSAPQYFLSSSLPFTSCTATIHLRPFPLWVLFLHAWCTVKRQASRSSETSLTINQTIWRQIRKENSLQSCGHLAFILIFLEWVAFIVFGIKWKKKRFAILATG